MSFSNFSPVLLMNRTPSARPCGGARGRRRLKRFLWLGMITLVIFHLQGWRAQAQETDSTDAVTVTGELTVVHGDDFDHHRGRFFYFLKDRHTQQTFELHFEDEPPGKLKSGTVVKVRGKALGRGGILAAGGNVETVTSAVATTSGGQQAVVMLINFQDKRLSCSTQAVDSTMFDTVGASVDGLYQEASFNQIWFGGNVVGPLTINYDSSGACDYWGWASAADSAARSSGVDLSQYNRKVYVMPSNSCGWAGLGTVGGNPSQAWIFRCDLDDVFGHELGHNLGMHHASTVSSEYGDVSDIMGYSGRGLRHVNAAHMDQMGWVFPDNILSSPSAGIYDIVPLELDTFDPATPQMIKIAKPDTNETYYFSYRQPIGYDADLSSTYLTGVNVHRHQGGAVQTVYLTTLNDGESFVDTFNGVSVTQLRHGPDAVTVEISVDCQSASPTVSLSPSKQSGTSGTTLSYGIVVTNQDTAACPDATFTLDTASLPAGWAATLTPEVTTLPPGQTASATLSVTSPFDAADGSYGVSVQAADGSESNHTATGNGTYTVSTSTSTKGKGNGKGGGGGGSGGKGGGKKK